MAYGIGRSVSPPPMSPQRALIGGNAPLLSGSSLHGPLLAGHRSGSAAHTSTSHSPVPGPRRHPGSGLPSPASHQPPWANGSLQLPRGSAVPGLNPPSLGSATIQGGSLGVASLARTASETFFPGSLSRGGASPHMLRVSSSMSPTSRERLATADRSMSPVTGIRTTGDLQTGYGSQFMFGRDRSPSLDGTSRVGWHTNSSPLVEPQYAHRLSDDFRERHRSPATGRGPLSSRSNSPSMRYASRPRASRHQQVAGQQTVPRAPHAFLGRPITSAMDRSMSPPQVAPVSVAPQTPLYRLATMSVHQSPTSGGATGSATRGHAQRSASPRAAPRTAQRAVSPRWTRHPAPWEAQPGNQSGLSSRSTMHSPATPGRHGDQQVVSPYLTARVTERLPSRRQVDEKEQLASPEESWDPSRPLTEHHARGKSPRPSITPTHPFQSPREELQEGAWVRLGECACQIKHALGMGSFGAVWAAERPTGAELAVKEILCHSHSELLNALFESHLLRVLGSEVCPEASSSQSGADDLNALGGEGDSEGIVTPNPQSPRGTSGIIPTLMACDTLRVSQDIWRVRLAMSRVHGESLDRFLERRRHKQEQIPKYHRQYHEACHFARELLVQLVPVFEGISSVAFHRDVNSHNILIDLLGAMQPSYGLVDFGLAVDAACWCSEEGAALTRPSRIGRDGVSTWHYLDVGGDCRYWPISAWMQFLAGWRKLESCPSLRFEYQMQLDLHALGITALQVFAEMMPVPCDADQSADGKGGDWEGTPSEIRSLLRHWDRYWGRVSPLHARLINTFHTKGDWDALKVDCINNGVHELLADDLRKLRNSIRKAGEACAPENFDQAGAGTNPAGASTFFAALLLLVSDGDGENMVSGPPAWQAIRELLASDGTARCPPGRRKMTMSNCSTASSAGNRDAASMQDSAARGRLASSEMTPKGQASATPVVLLPRPRRVCQEDVMEQAIGVSRLDQSPKPSSALQRGAPLSPPRAQPVSRNMQTPGWGATPISFELFRDQSPRPGGGVEQKGAGEENLACRLGVLKEKVDYLALEMKRLGEKGDDVGRRSVRGEQSSGQQPKKQPFQQLGHGRI